MAGELGSQFAQYPLLEGRKPVHLGFGTKRVEEFLSIRLERPVAHATHASSFRGRGGGAGGRAGWMALLHRAQRRQSAEAPVASRPIGWTRRPTPHRSGVPPFDRPCA